MEKIVQETNSYNDFLMQTKTFPLYSRIRKWVPTNIDEMYVFLGMVMAMAHVKKNRMKDYWAKDSLFSTPGFTQFMTYDRFLLMLKHLHFCDNRSQMEGDKLAKIRIVLEDIREKFSSKFKPFRDLCIDESLVLWRGRLSFRQFMPLKRHRFGMKLFTLCDVESGYILDFILYTGGGTDLNFDSELGYSGSVVKTMMMPYLDKGHNLYMDSWYASPTLFHFLHGHQTGACGTVQARRKKMPTFPNVRRGEMMSLHNNGVMCIKWRDKRVVHILTSIHADEMVNTGKRNHATGDLIQKPAAVVEYTHKARSVDMVDTMISNVDCMRKSQKWYKKLFFHILDMTVLNSYYMFLVRTGNKPPFADFSKAIIRQIIVRFSHHTYNRRPGRSPNVLSNPTRLVARHFPSEVPASNGSSKPRRRCHVCAHSVRRNRKRQTTHWMCSECGVGLCLPECFREYHTLANF